jgi:hypothetical protein
MYDYEKEDPTFKNDIELSKKAVDLGARFLSNNGFQVVIEPTFIRDNVKDAANFADSGDLKIMLPVEVKHRPTLKFNKKDGFLYRTIIIDACHIFDKHKIKPIYYLIYNHDYTSMIFINVKETHKEWVTVEKYDRYKNRKRKFYEVDVSKCTIVDCNNY